MGKRVSDEELIRLLEKHGTVRGAAVAAGYDISHMKHRVAALRGSGVKILAKDGNSAYVDGGSVKVYAKAYPKRIEYSVKDGKGLIGSDIHIWPGYVSTAQRAFLQFCEDYSPSFVCLNGDIFDFAGISRHHRIGWANVPTPMEELKAALPWIEQIKERAPGAKKFRTPGNHCLRLEGFISNRVPEVEGMPGSKLKYYMPDWDAAWAIHVNNTLWITHRLRGGKHAPYNNTREAGQSTCTGHLHNQQLREVTDLNGTRYGLDTGCMAEPFLESDWPQFEYTEGSPVDWRAGFAMVTFEDYKLVEVELVRVVAPGVVRFRGQKMEFPE